jgi:riboflavin kinase/FMN adenylyltransferase
MQQRLSSLESLGMDHTIIVAFSESFARKTPEQFVREFLIEALHAKAFVVGENFSFGHHKQGDLSLLKRMGAEFDFAVEGIREIYRDGLRISSSLIREHIMNGKMKKAREFLGAPFTLTGTVMEGEHLGARLGIPTANLNYENEIVPARGVYVSRAMIENRSYRAATNVGIRPTFQGTRLTVEAHLLDFTGDLYGARIDLQFFDKLRDEVKFSSADELKLQIRDDIERTRSYTI